MDPTRSALIVPIPQAEPIVAAHRDRLDRSATWGVPAHITVLWPFLPPADITDHTHTVITQIATTVPRFDLTLHDIRWFDDRVVWLAPHPAEPLRTLTTRLTARFPQTKPYDGAHPEIVPHLTLGHDQPVSALRTAAADVSTHLPIHARVTALRLIVGVPTPGDSWTTHTEYPLG